MTTVHYLAYGSNLHPLRLAARVPSARVLDVVPMPGRKLAFHKRSNDRSGKCLLYVTDDRADVIYAVLYEFRLQEKSSLDVAEGAGKGYVQEFAQVTLGGVTYTPYIYAASASHIDASLSPYHWYKRLVLAGARYHNFSPGYIASIEAVPSIPDPVGRRTREYEHLLAQMDVV
jgi:hypothetical protein